MTGKHTDKIKFNKKYWFLEDGEIHYFATHNPYSKFDIVNKLNELENERARLSYELFRLRRIRGELESVKDDIEAIEMLEDYDVDGIIKLLLCGDG